jgi:hypothetical protein
MDALNWREPNNTETKIERVAQVYLQRGMVQHYTIYQRIDRDERATTRFLGNARPAHCLLEACPRRVGIEWTFERINNNGQKGYSAQLQGTSATR